MSDNFLSRWSKRKLEVRAQEKQTAETASLQAKDQQVGVVAMPTDFEESKAVSINAPEEPVSKPELPLPTEADLDAVKQGGDIKAFMVDKVSTELKNKAFKALFSRPEFNVMDGLDIYIDDYNKFTPLTQEDIGKMTLSKQLLSRPDLEVPKIGDIEAGLQKLGSTAPASDESGSGVLDKADAEKPVVPAEPETSDEVRVIPDASQVSDIEGESQKRSFESSEKK